MGLMELIKCALICTDFLAWPVIALGYPLFASIRAVESGSKYHLRKLVIYWILFALISLFEFSFVKIIQWIPLWSRIKLVAIFWIVMPQFDGACHAYQSLVRPVLFDNVEAVMDKFHKLKEEKPRKSETFADVAEGCIKANVREASEKVTANKHECTNSQRDIQVVELEEKNAEELSKQGSQAKVAAWVPKVTEAAATEVKEMTPQESNAKNRHPETPPLEKAQQQIEWRCDLCKMTTTNEIALNAHLQGRKHKSNCESLKAIKLGAENTGPSLSTIGKLNLSNVKTDAAAAAGKVKKTTPLKASVENSRPKTPRIKKVQQQWACDLCMVRASSMKSLNDHLQGSMHKFNCESLKANELSAKDTGPSPLAKGKLNKGNVNFGAIAEVIEATAKNSCPETPPTKKDQQEWNCNLCKVKTTSEITLNDHLRGSRHKINYESLVGELIAKDKRRR